MMKKIVSGGQTGVDRAALDAAIKLHIPHGGWCPKGRLAEKNTTIPNRYLLWETKSSKFSERTKLNIRDSDGTLIIVPQTPIHVTDGTVLTIDEVRLRKKPFLIVDLSNPLSKNKIANWINKNNIKTLNIAGPRESQSPGIYERSLSYMLAVFP